MSTYNVPYTFIPGTKAKANEVNENFAAVLEYIAQTKDSSADINFSNLTAKAKEVILNESSQGRLIGEIVTSTLPITDSCLHLLDGAVISGNGIYKEFVNYIAKLYANASTTPAYFTTENEWQSNVSTYGVCGKFVYNATANTVRLPKITGFIEGTITENDLGEITAAGLPNISGSFNGIPVGDADNYSASGAFSIGEKSILDNNGVYSTAKGYKRSINLNANSSSSLYGKSSKVQPQSTKVYYYIVLASALKTEIQVNIDNIATDINTKADTDLTNITNTAKNTISELSMPTNKTTTLSIGSTNSIYTAPANGWFFLLISINSNGYAQLSCNNLLSRGQNCGSTTGYFTASVPVKKGASCKLEYGSINTSANYNTFKFIYAVGSESEG